jgi:hypothetical protein
MEECDRRVKEDIESFTWSIDEELEEAGSKAGQEAPAPLAIPARKLKIPQPARQKVPSSTMSKTAAAALSMNDTTRSMQRRVVRPTQPSAHKKASSFSIPGLRTTKQPAIKPTGLSRKTSMEMKGIEVASRTTIGYNKGRVTASALAKGTSKVDKPKPKGTMTRSSTTLSDGSDKTITPARYAQNQASTTAEEQQWKERVPFLSIFDPNDDDDCDILAGGLPESMRDGQQTDGEEEEFELRLPD